MPVREETPKEGSPLRGPGDRRQSAGNSTRAACWPDRFDHSHVGIDHVPGALQVRGRIPPPAGQRHLHAASSSSAHIGTSDGDASGRPDAWTGGRGQEKEAATLAAGVKVTQILRMQDLKAERINLVVSPSDKALFEAAAKEVGLSLSSWIRTVSLAAARKIVGTRGGTRISVSGVPSDD